MQQQVNTRAVILDILMEINENGSYSHIVLNNALNKFQYLDREQRAFIKRVAQGTIEKQIFLDYAIDSVSKVKVIKMKPLIRNLLRMSVYQIFFMDSVPDSALTNEAVKLAGKRGFKTLSGFVNGVLRNIIRNKTEILKCDNPSVRYSVPQWLIDQIVRDYGEDSLPVILNAFEEDRPTYVRCNTYRASKEEIIKSLIAQRVSVSEVTGFDGALMISDYDYLLGLDAFKQGLINVQDLSSMLVGMVAAPSENDKIIDVCAAPGGKSMHMAIMMHGTGNVSARDISENKVMLMEQTAVRMGLSNVSFTVADALVPRKEDIESADIVLCDLPCSGLGIIGRKADIKYKMTVQKEEELIKLQRQILSVVSRYVKPGGCLVFSTCTINKGENIQNYNWIKDNLNLVPKSIEAAVPEGLIKNDEDRESVKSGYIQLIPGIHGTDGFFVSKFIKAE